MPGATRKAHQADRLLAIRLRTCSNTHLKDRSLTTPAAIGAAVGLPAAAAGRHPVPCHQWAAVTRGPPAPMAPRRRPHGRLSDRLSVKPRRVTFRAQLHLFEGLHQAIPEPSGASHGIQAVEADCETIGCRDGHRAVGRSATAHGLDLAPVQPFADHPEDNLAERIRRWRSRIGRHRVQS
jgi:hypothetical protein